MIVVSVLRCGPEYSGKHAQWLHRQLAGYDSVCLTDAGQIEGVNTVPLLYDWPGWWSKIEAFNPDRADIGNQDILLLDLDTVITGDLSPFMEKRPFTALTDFYCESQAQAPMASAVMYIPANVKARVWQQFIHDPVGNMRRHIKKPNHGDQGFVGSVLAADRWQDVLPSAAISYKKDVAAAGRWSRSVGNGSVPDDARLVCFHGQPRPWNSGEPWVPPLNY
ncbi:MAG: hypothetical protein ACOH2G_08580 [Ewingella sp.]